MADAKQIRYSNYNSYHNEITAWEVGGQFWSLEELQKKHDLQSHQLTPGFDVTDSKTTLTNAQLFAAGGPFGTPLGRYREEPRQKDLRLVIKPTVFSVSATTANLEWATSLPATCQLAWGETPACEHTAPFNINCFGTYSLTGLKPGQTYFFRIKGIETPKDMLPKTDLQSVVVLNDEPISFHHFGTEPSAGGLLCRTRWRRRTLRFRSKECLENNPPRGRESERWGHGAAGGW